MTVYNNNGLSQWTNNYSICILDGADSAPVLLQLVLQQL